MYYKSYVRFVDKHPDSTSKFKLCAIVMKGKRILSIGYNRARTDPHITKLIADAQITKMYEGSKRGYVSCNIHAETNALKRLKSSKADTVLVIRKDMNGRLCMARPCNVCMEALRNSCIKKIIYSTNDGTLEEIKL